MEPAPPGGDPRGPGRGAFWLKTRPKPAVVARPAAQESTEALLARGLREHVAGSLDAAMNTYHTILQREPANSTAHYNLGQIYAHRGQFAQAQWEQRHALEALAKATEPDFAASPSPTHCSALSRQIAVMCPH